ncbi:hypothetical protein PMIT1323_02540 [Prochlorococcus marinus str. MIT 1323]|nr:hypothetical protein PMIT1323_02540 [Prochlorococcus marinus str. MIT 1323]
MLLLNAWRRNGLIFLDVLDEVSQFLQAVAMATPRSQASMKQGTTFTRNIPCEISVNPHRLLSAMPARAANHHVDRSIAKTPQSQIELVF